MVQRRGKKAGPCGHAFALVVAGLMFLFFTLTFLSSFLRRTTWEEVPGVITALHKEQECRKNGCHDVFQPEVSFIPRTSSITFSFKSSLGSGDLNKYPVGSTVQVLYDPDHPQSAEMKDEISQSMYVSGFVSLFLLVWCSLFGYGLCREGAVPRQGLLAAPLYQTEDATRSIYKAPSSPNDGW